MTPREELQALRRIAELEAKASAPPKAVLGDDPGFFEAMMIGGGKSATRIGQGVQQLYYGATGNAKEQARLKAEVEEEDRLYKPLQEARPWATGIGEALPSFAVPVGAGVGLLANAGRMAVAGAAPGLLEYGSAEERLKRGAAGAAAGAAMPIAGAAGRTVYSMAEPLFEGGRKTIAGRTLNRAAGEGAKAAAGKMDRAAELVPGSRPTAAQVAENGGIAAMERSAAAATPEAYTTRAMEQAAARTNAIRGIAGDEQAMAAAVAKRQSAADPLYKAADAGIAPIDGMFQGLAQRPQFARAIERAQTLARDGGLADIFFRDDKGNPIALIGEGAHFIKKALDEAAEFGSTSYMGKSSAGAAGQTNELFQQWLSKSIPEYGAAKQAFADGSRPINQMQIGQSLLDSVGPALRDYGALGKETGAAYARALRNGDATAAKATGMSGANLADVLSPEQMKLVEGVARDLARKTNAQDLGRGSGSDTFQKLSMQNIAQQSGMPRAAGGLLNLPGVSRATNWLYRDNDEKMQRLLADVLLDPKAAADLMRRAGLPGDGNRAQQLLLQAMSRAGLLAAPAAGQSIAP